MHAILGTVGCTAQHKLIGAIVLHYADGSQHELEIVYGRHVRHWWTEGDPRTDTDLAQVAWEGPHGYPAIYSTRLRIYHTVWDNPRPDQVIVSIMAGVGTARIEAVFSHIRARVVRVMPRGQEDPAGILRRQPRYPRKSPRTGGFASPPCGGFAFVSVRPNGRGLPLRGQANDALS